MSLFGRHTLRLKNDDLKASLTAVHAAFQNADKEVTDARKIGLSHGGAQVDLDAHMFRGIEAAEKKLGAALKTIAEALTRSASKDTAKAQAASK